MIKIAFLVAAAVIMIGMVMYVLQPVMEARMAALIP